MYIVILDLKSSSIDNFMTNYNIIFNKKIFLIIIPILSFFIEDYFLDYNLGELNFGFFQIFVFEKLYRTLLFSNFLYSLCLMVFLFKNFKIVFIDIIYITE